MGLETGGSIDKIVERAERAVDAGVRSLWSSQIFGHDTLTVLALVGDKVPRVDLGTAVIPIYTRHPTMLAAQALTVQAATGGRLTLGIGLSHEMVVEGIWGLSYSKPARYMREYLSILLPLVRGEQIGFSGEVLSTNTLGPLDNAIDDPPPVIVAALGPTMLRIAGEMTDGTCTWMTGPKTLSDHIVPTISRAAGEAGKPPPRVVASLPVCVTADPDAARTRAAREFAVYGHLPSYRAMLDREGAEGPPDVAIVGDEDAVAAGIAAMAEAGASELSASIFGSAEERERTRVLIGQLAMAAEPADAEPVRDGED
jgi:F420-dependent oxidoreductase-like protein